VTHRTRSVAEIREEERVARRDLRAAVDQGLLSLPIDRVFPLDQAVEALAHMKANAHLGKIILQA
jgi:NADPH2:quinone reductase